MIERGFINLDVSEYDLKTLEFKDYLQCYQQTPELKLYYTKENSSIWQMLSESPQWVHNIAKQLPQDFVNHVVSVINIPPGQIVPWHHDYHRMLRETYNVSGTTHRYLVFLEDWKRGHYFEIEDNPIVQWKAGDWVKFTNEDWHIGGNMGIDPFYSVQVTVKLA